MTEEILDIVDSDDQVIGVMPRNEVYSKGMTNFRVINCFIKNSKGELWIPRRVATKKLFPLSLDMSCGGHVSSGETYGEAFAKEMKEELNIDISLTSWREVGTFTPHRHGVGAFMKVYEVTQDETPGFNRDDYFEYLWITPEDLMKKLESGEKTKGDLPRLLKLLYL